jgi:hypothetical protein
MLVMVFEPLCSRKMLINALKLGFVYILLLNLPAISFFLLFSNNSFPVYILPILPIALYLVVIYLSVRLILTPFLYILDPLHKPSGHLQNSFHYMKGKVGQYLWLMFTASWWMFLVYFVLVRVGDVASPFVGRLFLSLTFPYICLISAGFFESLSVWKNKSDEHA